MAEGRGDAVTIRAADEADAAAIAGVRVAAWRGAYRGLMPDALLDRPDLEASEARALAERLRSLGAGAHVAVAAVGARMVGYCAYGPGGDGEPHVGAVYDLYVHPDAWRQGVGRRLLERALEHLGGQGARAATLFVFEQNVRARAFYEAAGWAPDGHRELYERPEFALPVLRYRTACR
jgi:ribosomal protein S18 acetylase RimI-like enzyme